MIRVLNIISDTNIGGAGRVLLNYLRYCDKNTYDASVALPRGSMLKTPLEDLGTTVYEVDGIADRSFDRQDVRVLKNLIRQVKPDIVHTHGALSGRIAARQMGCKVVYTRHSAFPVPAKLKYPPGRWVNKWVNEHYADRIIAVSPAAAENLTDGGISPKVITTMMNGVQPVVRRSESECAALRRTLGLSPETFVFGIMARLEPYKGHSDLLQAAKRLKEDGYQNFTILFAGTGTCEAELRTATEEMQLNEQIKLLGFVEDVSGILSLMDVQLNASYGTETSSLSILEGFSMGLPAVVSDYGGNPYLVDDGKDGLLFRTRDVADLAKKMAYMMDEPEALQKMAENSMRIFNERFTGEIYAKNVEAVYETVMKG